MRDHLDVSKTLQLLQHSCQFLNMRQHVETYIKRCLSCQQNKHETHVKYDEIQYQTPSESPWDEVMMNFIIKLPKSKDATMKEEYNAILVIVDWLMKYFHIVVFKEKYTAEQLKHIVMNRLIRYHRIPKKITSDRDKLFTSNYWKTLIPLLETKLRMSTAYHSEINEQTERMNQSLEQYLRHYINTAQNNWVSLLSMTQLALNFKESDTMKTSSFFVNFRKEPHLFSSELLNWAAQSVIERTETLKRVHDNITRMQHCSADYQNRKRKMAPQLKERNKVYLLTKNLQTKKSSKKLDHKKIRSFYIRAAREEISYKLHLSSNIRIHSVFHILLLEPADSSTPIQETFHYETQKETEFKVEEILQQKDQHYLIKWKNYLMTEAI